MKLFSIKWVSIAVVLLFAIVLYSCQKDNTASTTPVTEEEAVTYADESTQAEASFDDVEDIGRVAAEEEGEVSAPNGRFFPFQQLRLRLGPCAVITVTPNDSTYPKTVTIDFPGEGCWCADGKHRKGTIVIHFTAPIRRAGSVVTISLHDFFLNRAHIEGTKVITNLSANGAIKYTVQVAGGKVTLPNGRGYKYDGLKAVGQIDGSTTPNFLDDVYRIEGRSKTEFNNGVTVNLNTESPLIKKVACDWINNGTVKIKINDRVLFLDFGAPANGDCDNKALLTWNNGNNQRLITLP
jgi:hypothetical protein